MNVENCTVINQYKILSSIGKGGMGEVFLAEDTRLDRKVAVKFLNEEFSRDTDKLNRFIQEAKAVSALNHPNILTVHEIGENEDSNYIVTEFIEGKTLREHLSSDESISLSAILKVGVQVAEALSAAHQAGIIHRDIKPENIMIRADGYAKVLDFGLAKLTEKKKSERISLEGETKAFVQTNPGVVMGTVSYLSPEQARGKETDARTDIWSLGVVLYEMLAGRVPFAGETINHTIVSILEKEPMLLENVPDELQRIVRKALTKDKEMRYQTARDLLIDLKNLRRNLDIQGELERSVVPNREAKTEPLGENATQIYAEKSIEETKSEEAQATQNITSSSSLEYAVTQAKSHKIVTAAAAMILLSIISAIVYFNFFAKGATKQIESIAVMPFVNESGDADIEYLSDGMTETLIGSLSQIPKLNVKARSSVFRYKGREANANAVGKELNVQAVLTGRVVQRGEHLILYVELVDAATENSLWKQSYNKTMTNLIALQTDVARDVADRLKVKLSGADEKKLTKNYTENSEAYQLYLKGRYQTIKLSPQEILKGVSYFQEAIRLDPNYALAHVGLSDAYRSLALGGEQPPNEYFPKAKAAANRAIEIDDALGEAHAVLGFIIYWYDWDWATAEKHLKRALELNPNNSDAHFAYGQFLSTLGRYDEGLAELKRARELEPLNARTASLEARFLANAGRRDESVAAFRQIFEINPDYWFAYTQAANAYNNEKMYTEAAAAARKAREINEFSSQAIALEGYALAKSGRQTEARAALQELLRLSEQRNIPPTNIALVYYGLNEKDKALTWLERAYRDKDARIVFLKIDRLWDDLREEPRFQDLRRRLNLPE